MIKLINRTYKGIEYIELSSLPVAEAESLKASLTQRTLIKILKDDEVLKDCVLYSAYEKWFAANYKEVEKAKLQVIQTSKTAYAEPIPAV